MKQTMRIKIPVLSKAQQEAQFILGGGHDAFREPVQVPKPVIETEAELRIVPGYGYATGDPSRIGTG